MPPAALPRPACGCGDVSLPVTFHPATEDQARDAVRWAVAGGSALEIRGRGSKRGFGRPVEAAAMLDLSGLSGITLYEPEELVLTAAAGTPLAEIEAAIAARGQMLAFEPPDLGPFYGGPAGQGTLGGLVAANLSGPRRFKAGAARDHVLGIHAVSGRGEAFKSGSRVVKNVTGYDLPKLLTGSFGTLAAMTRITVKVLPAPETACSLELVGLDDETAIAALTAALKSPFDVSGAAHLPAGIQGAEARTVLRVEGFGPSVDSRRTSLAALLGSFGEVRVLDTAESAALFAAIRDVRPFAADGRIVWRVSVAPTVGPIVASAVGGAAFYDWGGGLVWIALPAAMAADDAGAGRVRAAVATAGGGHATLMRAPDAVRSRVPVFQPEGAGIAALSARVRHGFDPHAILSPGRMSG
jgi:glycolate oxidase FAD binding subunit